MNYKIKRIISTICFVAAVVSITFFPVSASCETLRFVFLADSRANDNDGDKPLDNPVNTEALKPIIKKIGELNPTPAFVMFGGDMSYRGYIYTGSNKIGYTFQTWKDLFKDLTDAGIPLYTALGNHELYRHDDENPNPKPCKESFCLENQEAYKNVFSENPQNGPPGYDGLVYSFTSSGGDAFFAVLDPYYITQDTTPNGLGGHIDDIQLRWLKKKVAKTRATHKFLFIHTPYYYATGQNPEELSTTDVSLTKLWTILDNNRFDLYACGHQHLYSRKTVNRWLLPQPQTTPPRPPWRHNVVQLLNGTSGADPDQGTPTAKDPKSWHIHQAPNTYYFSVVDIQGRCSKVTSYSYNTNTEDYGVIDEFTISHNPFDESVYNQDVLEYPWMCYGGGADNQGWFGKDNQLWGNANE